MAAIVLIEDDPRIRDSITRALIGRGHNVRSAGTALAGLQLVVEDLPDLVVLDLGLPDVDGRILLGRIREHAKVPVIVATARDDDAEIVRTLDAGADDYVVKPFSAEQLDARIRALLRRSKTEDGRGEYVVGGLCIDLRTHTAVFEGDPLELTRKEFEMLAYLAARPTVVVTKSELMAEVWRQPEGGPDRTVDVHLSWLRRKLGETAAEPRYLRSIRGVGVRLVDPNTTP